VKPPQRQKNKKRNLGKKKKKKVLKMGFRFFFLTPPPPHTHTHTKTVLLVWTVTGNIVRYSKKLVIRWNTAPQLCTRTHFTCLSIFLSTNTLTKCKSGDRSSAQLHPCCPNRHYLHTYSWNNFQYQILAMQTRGRSPFVLYSYNKNLAATWIVRLYSPH